MNSPIRSFCSANTCSTRERIFDYGERGVGRYRLPIGGQRRTLSIAPAPRVPAAARKPPSGLPRVLNSFNRSARIHEQCAPKIKSNEKSICPPCFDASWDEGAFGIGLVGGAHFGVNRIQELLQRGPDCPNRFLAGRPHASLDGMTPDQAYFTPLPFRSAA